MSPRSRRPPNLAVLGAGGAVGRAVLTYLPPRRRAWGSLLLIDPRPVVEDRYVRPRELGARVERLEVTERTARRFARLLEEHEVDVLLDVSFAPTELVADVVFSGGRASYVCTAYCDPGAGSLAQAVGEWLDRLAADPPSERPHVLFSGMNPGAVNVVAAIGVERHGRPLEIVEFEHDTSAPRRRPRADAVTWSPSQFVAELRDPSEVALGRDGVATLARAAALAREDMEALLAPVLPMRRYPEGFVVMHEECLTLGRRWDVPVRFVYAVRDETMRYVEGLVRDGQEGDGDALALLDHVRDPLLGSDTVGLRLEYEDRVVCYVNRVSNARLKETSATAYQVAVGVHAALHALAQGEVPPGPHLPEDLLDTSYATFVTDNLMFEEHVLRRRRRGRLERVALETHLDAGRRPFVRM